MIRPMINFMAAIIVIVGYMIGLFLYFFDIIDGFVFLGIITYSGFCGVMMAIMGVGE